MNPLDVLHDFVVYLSNSRWIQGGSPRMLVDAFGRPDVFC